MLCPKCKSDRAHRSHRRGLWEHVVSLVAFYPFRCRACDHRFLLFRYAAPPGSDHRPTSAEIEVRATRAAVRWKHKKQEILLYAIGVTAFVILMFFLMRMGRN